MPLSKLLFPRSLPSRLLYMYNNQLYKFPDPLPIVVAYGILRYTIGNNYSHIATRNYHTYISEIAFYLVYLPIFLLWIQIAQFLHAIQLRLYRLISKATMCQDHFKLSKLSETTIHATVGIATDTIMLLAHNKQSLLVYA